MPTSRAGIPLSVFSCPLGIYILDIASKAGFGARVTVLNLQDANIQFRIAIAGENKRSDDLNQPHHIFIHTIINDVRSAADQYAIIRPWHAGWCPGSRIRPTAIVRVQISN